MEGSGSVTKVREILHRLPRIAAPAVLQRLKVRAHWDGKIPAKLASMQTIDERSRTIVKFLKTCRLICLLILTNECRWTYFVSVEHDLETNKM